MHDLLINLGGKAGVHDGFMIGRKHWSATIVLSWGCRVEKYSTIQQLRKIYQWRASGFSRRMGSVGLLKRDFPRDNGRRKAEEVTMHPSMSGRWKSSRRCVQ